jgi:hypothetical protein
MHTHSSLPAGYLHKIINPLLLANPLLPEQNNIFFDQKGLCSENSPRRPKQTLPLRANTQQILATTRPSLLTILIFILIVRMKWVAFLVLIAPVIVTVLKFQLVLVVIKVADPIHRRASFCGETRITLITPLIILLTSTSLSTLPTLPTLTYWERLVVTNTSLALITWTPPPSKKRHILRPTLRSGLESVTNRDRKWISILPPLRSRLSRPRHRWWDSQMCRL